ncbi:sensor histidine kinase [Reichenbachiella sp. MALMAid0571]|uniref:sensor histidine kinase n=1 Tax=Reichenbachiella sp. MALMAid0571 TaxID=3143939 RepID=UPI0032DF87B6
MTQSTSYDLSTVNSCSFKKILFYWVAIPLIGGLIISIFLNLEGLKQGDYRQFATTTVLSTVFWTVLMNGNRFIEKLLDKRWTWIGQPGKRFVIGMLALAVFTVLASCFILLIYLEVYLNLDFKEVMSKKGWAYMLSLPVSVTFFIAFVMHGRSFLISWRQTAIDLERMKNKNLISQYESLKNQVNPHFLFNTLNALLSLVYSDQDKAADFIRKFADVYHYVLEHQFDEVVTLSTELKYVKSFLHLNIIRFGDNLYVDIRGEENINSDFLIPPLALQMLLENAFKHNEVSKRNQLIITISIDSENIIVSHNKNPMVSEEKSSGVGLNNISARYDFLTGKKIRVVNTDEQFEVSLPIIKIKRNTG